MMKHFLHKLLQTKWNIGFIDNAVCDILHNEKISIHWMQHPFTDRWFADPFILDVTDEEITLLVEELHYKSNKGYISKLIVNRSNYKLKTRKTILELETHLSFPIFFEKENEIIIYPENSETGKLNSYILDRHRNKLTFKNVVINEPLTDAVIVKLNSLYYLFSTCLPYPNGRVLHIYCSDNWDSHYKLMQKVNFSDCAARNAGNFFYLGDKLIRPAQDCTKAYGHGLILQEVTFSNGSFLFNELKRIYPDSWHYNLGLHTLNIRDNLLVVDGRGYKNPLTGHFVDIIRKIITKLK